MPQKTLHQPVMDPRAPVRVLLMLLAFGGAVVITRLFLELTGYPQIGSEIFHFAHALWGGLLLVIAVIITLVFINHWLYTLAAVLAGVGVGLFIDEVGKFITQSNDYFFPLAAPIIYAAFIIIVMVYLFLRQERETGVRAEMYSILADIQEVLDDDLEVSEHAQLVARLKPLCQQTQRPDLAALASSLLDYLQSGAVRIVPDRERFYQRLLRQWGEFELRWLPIATMRRLLVIIFVFMGMLGAIRFGTALLLVFGRRDLLSELISSILVSNPQVSGMNSLVWYLALVLMEGINGLLILLTLVAFLLHRDEAAVQVGSASLIFTLTVINILSFYYHQFSVVLSSLLLFAVLLLIQSYRRRRSLRLLPSFLNSQRQSAPA